jgi:hypothetical protein
MYCLESIVQMNNNAVARAKSKDGSHRSQTDHSSFTGNPKRGIILHSGAHRECAMIEGVVAENFLSDYNDIPTRLAAKNKGRSVPARAIMDARDTLIESYF